MQPEQNLPFGLSAPSTTVPTNPPPGPASSLLTGAATAPTTHNPTMNVVAKNMSHAVFEDKCPLYKRQVFTDQVSTPELEKAERFRPRATESYYVSISRLWNPTVPILIYHGQNKPVISNMISKFPGLESSVRCAWVLRNAITTCIALHVSRLIIPSRFFHISTSPSSVQQAVE